MRPRNVSLAPNGASPTIGKVGQGFSFDGVDDYVDSGTSATTLFSNTDSFTLSAFVKLTGSGRRVIVSRHNDQSNTFNYLLDVNSGYARLGADKAYVAGIYAQSTTLLDNDTWYHVVGVYDNGTMKLYLNGNLEDTESFAQTSSGDVNANVYIGAIEYSSSYKFNGTIDEVRIYSRALSASEISQLYRMGR